MSNKARFKLRVRRQCEEKDMHDRLIAHTNRKGGSIFVYPPHKIEKDINEH